MADEAMFDAEMYTLLMRDDCAHDQANVLVTFSDPSRARVFHQWLTTIVPPTVRGPGVLPQLIYPNGATIGFIRTPLKFGPGVQLRALWLLDELDAPDRTILAPMLTEFATVRDVTRFGR